ncbi:Rhodanese-like domain-containing protein [Fomitopsis serialis]|uniref:Rhodanese-like domain-containing protein n=1 Tax=Fomitopsis serialis TaxID=139415 RepID=UPI00200846CA|nr:Rhodanese-like domain-containing protein [Neoantrodia serialis]KAH9937486.1 Rhodanese-like domain-containing protein [Neoantrodia serialis]
MLPRALLSPRTSLRSLAGAARPLSSGSVFGDACPLTLTPAQLRGLDPRSVSVLDASWHMPSSPRNPRQEWLQMRIPGAQLLDLDEVASQHALGLKHMMPSPDVFAKACENYGITPESHVVMYDTHGVFSSPRALYMFRAFGHHRSSILDGGLPAWIAYGSPTNNGDPEPVPTTTYPVPKLDDRVVRSYEQIVANSALDPSRDSLADIVLDARSKDRYLGTAPEPRAGLSSGHIPHSLSLPFASLLNTVPAPTPAPRTSLPVPPAQTAPALSAHPPQLDSPSARTPELEPPTGAFPWALPEQYTTLKTSTQILGVLEAALGRERLEEVLEGRRGVVASCGSGMTAGVVWLALQMVGAKGAPAIYDESWTGYAMRPESKIEKAE